MANSFSLKRWLLPVVKACAASCVLAVVLFLPPLQANLYAAHTKANPSEKKLRAAVIVGILRFTSWSPPASDPKIVPVPTPEPNAPLPLDIQICLAGNPLASSHLTPLDGKHRIKGRHVKVRLVSLASEIRGCQVLVLGEDIKRQTSKAMLKYANKNAMISLCDGCSKRSASDAIVSLVLRKHRINFEVDWVKAKANGILFDASLLELASNQSRR